MGFCRKTGLLSQMENGKTQRPNSSLSFVLPLDLHLYIQSVTVYHSHFQSQPHPQGTSLWGEVNAMTESRINAANRQIKSNKQTVQLCLIFCHENTAQLANDLFQLPWQWRLQDVQVCKQQHTVSRAVLCGWACLHTHTDTHTDCNWHICVIFVFFSHPLSSRKRWRDEKKRRKGRNYWIHQCTLIVPQVSPYIHLPLVSVPRLYVPPLYE